MPEHIESPYQNVPKHIISEVFQIEKKKKKIFSVQ